MSYSPASNFTMAVIRSICQPLSYLYNFTQNATIELSKERSTEQLPAYCTHIKLLGDRVGRMCVTGIGMTKEYAVKELNDLSCNVKLTGLANRIYRVSNSTEGYIELGIFSALATTTAISTSKAITAIKEHDYARAIGWGFIGCGSLFFTFEQLKKIAGV